MSSKNQSQTTKMSSFCHLYNELQRLVQFGLGPTNHKRKDKYLPPEKHKEEYTEVLTQLKKRVIPAFFSSEGYSLKLSRQFSRLTGATVQIRSRICNQGYINPVSINIKDNLGELHLHFCKDELTLKSTLERLKVDDEKQKNIIDSHLKSIDHFFVVEHSR